MTELGTDEAVLQDFRALEKRTAHRARRYTPFDHICIRRIRAAHSLSSRGKQTRLRIECLSDSCAKQEWAVAYAARNCNNIVLPFCGHLAAADRIKIDVRQVDGAIREQLFTLTRRGMPTEQVYAFVESHLHRDGPVVGWPSKTRRKRFGNFFSASLGRYFEPRNLFVFPTVVQAFWYFEHDKLRDIRVRRVVSGM